MRYSMGYEVLLVEKKIVMTKDFARKAAIIGTEEYTRYMQLRNAYPTFTLGRYTIEQNTTREKYDKLTYASMAILIAEWFPSSNDEMDEFERIKREAKAYSGSYGIVKRWFLENYKDRYMARKTTTTSAD